MADERTRLIALARELEQEAEDPPETFDQRLADFNAALSASCDRRTFEYLYQSMNVEELVDSLLARRAALPAVTAPITVTPETLPAFFGAREHGHYDHDAGHDEYQRDVAALATLSRLPTRVLGLLLESQLPADERAAFALAYRPPASLADVRETARALAQQMLGTPSPRGEVGIDLLEHELTACPDPELAMLLQLAQRQDIRFRAYCRKLGFA